jgi:hypothetical protein
LKTGSLQLVELLGPSQILQTVETEVAQGGTLWERVRDEAGRRRRDEDLSAVGDGRHACGAMNLESDKTGGGLFGLTGVDTHPHTDRLG